MNGDRRYSLRGYACMIPFGFVLRVLVVLCLFGVAACSNPECGPRVRIKTFTWDGMLYRARYNAAGKLVALEGSGRAITFLYDENGKLYKSRIDNVGESVPVHTYDYTQGAMGITEILTSSRNDDYDGQLHPVIIQKMEYLTPIKLSALIDQYVEEAGDSIVPSTHYYYRFTYGGNNVSLIDMIPVFTEYKGQQYDGKVNPFRMLAEAVGNPAFFPVGLYANFPVVDFNIPRLSVFSQNNPVRGEYLTVENGLSIPQTFTNSYEHGLVKKIVWRSTFSPDYPSDFRMFNFEYEWAPAP